MSVRTPMRWDLVAEQERTSDSLLRFVRRLAHQRREAPELGWGISTLLLQTVIYVPLLVLATMRDLRVKSF